jgi:7 transmembrane receptor (rhodopsin family)
MFLCGPTRLGFHSLSLEQPKERDICSLLTDRVFNCVTGNFLVILVVQCDRQVESKTNFLLGQLALADLCVGVFCVMQSFMAYLSK